VGESLVSPVAAMLMMVFLRNRASSAFVLVTWLAYVSCDLFGSGETGYHSVDHCYNFGDWVVCILECASQLAHLRTQFPEVEHGQYFTYRV
jgi:hypothetical protein